MENKKTYQNIYEYLEPILETGSEEDIARARREYWRKYKAEWRKQKRREVKEFAVVYTAKELIVVNHAAKKHRISITKYIKESALAYANNRFLVVDVEGTHAIRELLSLCYNELQQISEYQEKSELLELLLKKVAILEKKVLERINNPPLVIKAPLNLGKHYDH